MNLIEHLLRLYYLRRMKVRPSEEHIKEMAELIDCGFVCHFNTETGEIVQVPDQSHPYVDMSLWEEDLSELEDESEKFIFIDSVSSRDGYQIMKDFALSLNKGRLKNKLLKALERKKPFRNFGDIMRYEDEMRDEWFKFKTAAYQEHVRAQIKMHEEEEMDYEYDEDDYEYDEPMNLSEIKGTYRMDDGTPVNPDDHPKPSLCLLCKKNDDPNEEILCNLNRMDQLGAKEFICAAHVPVFSEN